MHSKNDSIEIMINDEPDEVIRELFDTLKKCHSIYQYAKANNKYMKNYDKNKESSYIQYCDANNLYGWAMLQKLSVNKFKWIKDTSEFNKDLITIYNEESDAEYFLEIDVRYLEKLNQLQNDLPFLPERMKIENVEKLVVNLNMLYT